MNFLKSLLAPFVIVKREKMYIGWIIYAVLFGLINFIADLLMGNLENVFEYIRTGQFYTFSIALISPFIIDILLSILVEWRSTKSVHFLKYKITCILITIVLMIIMTFLWLGDHKQFLGLQVVFTTISLTISYYMFLVSHMQEHAPVTQQYDDKEYLDCENERLESVQQKANETSLIDMKGEHITL